MPASRFLDTAEKTGYKVNLRAVSLRKVTRAIFRRDLPTLDRGTGYIASFITREHQERRSREITMRSVDV